jgi:hypothetical protein
MDTPISSVPRLCSKEPAVAHLLLSLQLDDLREPPLRRRV